MRPDTFGKRIAFVLRWVHTRDMSRRRELDESWAPTDPSWVRQTWPDASPRGVLPEPSDTDRTRIWNLDGTSWADAPIPSRWHRCKAQTYGVMDWFMVVKRCACGAISSDDRVWIDRNSRRRVP